MGEVHLFFGMTGRCFVLLFCGPESDLAFSLGGGGWEVVESFDSLFLWICWGRLQTKPGCLVRHGCNVLTWWDVCTCGG